MSERKVLERERFRERGVPPIDAMFYLPRGRKIPDYYNPLFL
jgi:hypothetical protein